MRVANTTQTNYLVDSTQLAKLETQKDKLIALFKAGLITEQKLAYCMHKLCKQEDFYSELDSQDADELDTQELMWLATKREKSFIYGRAKSRSYGLTRIREARHKAQRTNYYLDNIED